MDQQIQTSWLNWPWSCTPSMRKKSGYWTCPPHRVPSDIHISFYKHTDSLCVLVVLSVMSQKTAACKQMEFVLCGWSQGRAPADGIPQLMRNSAAELKTDKDLTCMILVMRGAIMKVLLWDEPTSTYIGCTCLCMLIEWLQVSIPSGVCLRGR